MITPSTSSRFTAEATPAPSAITARSMIWWASLSCLSRARAHTPLVRRVRSGSFISLKRSGLPPLLDEPAGMLFHRRAARVGLHAATAAARAAGAVDLHDHVPDLPRAAAARPRPPVEDQPAAHARPPEDAEQRAIQPPGPEPELGVGGHLHVVADAHLCAEI